MGEEGGPTEGTGPAPGVEDGRDPRFAGSLPELDRFDDSVGRDEREPSWEEGRPIAGGGLEKSKIVLPAQYDTSSTVIVCANTLGSAGWDPVYSRFRCYSYEPVVDDLIDELEDMGRHGGKAVPEAIMMVVKSAHKSGEVLDLDLRAVIDAVEDLETGESWEDALRDSFIVPATVDILEFAEDVIEWLAQKEGVARSGRGTVVGRTFTDRDLGQEVGSLRGDRNKERRNRVLDYLSSQGWIQRHSPPAHVRPGARGRRARWSFSVLRVPA